MKSIYDYPLSKLEGILVLNGYKKYNAVQIYDWLYKKRVNSFDDMHNLSKELISYLKENYTINTLKLLTKLESTDTNKYLFELNDGNKIEAVLMKHDYGNSLCVSTEVGCNMGCAFCESGRLKRVRALVPSEMVEQILIVEKESNIKLTHIVLMGIGEPFDNYDNVMDFIDIINDQKGIEIGARHITVSTCGIVPKIEEFMNNPKQVNLAISLHAPNDELRNKLMPINKAYNLSSLMNAVKDYLSVSGRRVTFEYIMLKGVNDHPKEALELSELLKGINCYVNLIPYNETSHIEFKKTSNEDIMKFYDILKKHGLNVTVRREFGSELKAACGQLRSNYEEENK